MTEAVSKITIATIGFTRSSAENFFGRLLKSQIKTVIDVRLHNTSQLAGFAKADDLAFFLKRIGNIEYRHVPLLAPEEHMLNEYKKGKGSWDSYASNFINLMAHRKIEEKIEPATLEGSCLLCSESTPHHCHRRLVYEYLNQKWNNVLAVKHL